MELSVTAPSTNLCSLSAAKRRVWHDHRRNRLIAQAARRLAADGNHVLLVVESLEHAVRVLRELPAWPLLSGTEIHLDGLSASDRTLVTARQIPVSQPPALLGSPGTIATLVGLNSVNWRAVDVVVRADGGRGLLPLPWEANHLPYGTPTLRLVDFRDRSSAELRRAASARKQAYTRAGWSGHADSEQSRIQRFLQGTFDVPR